MNQPAINRALSITENSSLFANKVAPHNCVALVDFEGSISKKIFLRALRHIENVYPCLLSRIESNPKTGIRIISDGDVIPFSECFINTKQEFDCFFEREINLPFNLLRSALIRLTHLKYGNNSRLVITMHHLICDGVSLAYFVGFLFETIESLMCSRPLIDKSYSFQKIEEIISLHEIELSSDPLSQNQSNVLSLSEDRSFFPAYTKAFNFKMKAHHKSYRNGVGINYLLLAIAGMALRNILSIDKEIKYVIPVNMRPYAVSQVSNYDLGFYSSWVEFEVNPQPEIIVLSI